MKSDVKVYYWQAADRIVAVHHGRIIDILDEHHRFRGLYGMMFTVEKTQSKLPKTLVYLGDL